MRLKIAVICTSNGDEQDEVYAKYSTEPCHTIIVLRAQLYCTKCPLGNCTQVVTFQSLSAFVVFHAQKTL